MEATEDTGFQAETLRGDVQDKILDGIARQMPCWTKMSEKDQRRIINESARIADELVREVVRVIAHRDFPHMVVSLGKATLKDGIKVEVSGSDAPEEISKFATHRKSGAILVFANAGDFLGSRAEPQADKDEPELPMAEQPGHDPETGELLDGHQGEAGEDLPETGDLPEPPADEEDEGDAAGEDGGETEAAIDPQPEPEARPSRRRASARQTADA